MPSATQTITELPEGITNSQADRELTSNFKQRSGISIDMDIANTEAERTYYMGTSRKDSALYRAGHTIHFGYEVEKPMCGWRAPSDFFTQDIDILNCEDCINLVGTLARYALDMPHKFPRKVRILKGAYETSY